MYVHLLWLIVWQLWKSPTHPRILERCLLDPRACTRKTSWMATLDGICSSDRPPTCPCPCRDAVTRNARFREARVWNSSAWKVTLRRPWRPAGGVPAAGGLEVPSQSTLRGSLKAHWPDMAFHVPHFSVRPDLNQSGPEGLLIKRNWEDFRREFYL